MIASADMGGLIASCALRSDLTMLFKLNMLL